MNIERSDIEGERYPGEFSEWRGWQASGLNAPTIQEFRSGDYSWDAPGYSHGQPDYEGAP